MTTDLSPISVAVARVEPGCAIDAVAEALGKVHWAKQQLAEIEAELKARLLARVLTGGAFVVGEQRFYADYPKQTKCLSVRDAVESILQHNGGDFDGLVACLSANAIKHGATAKVLPPDVYARCFKTKRVAKLGQEPAKELMTVDTRYLPARAATEEVTQ